MGRNDHIDFEMIERVDELLRLGYFVEGTPEYGIARMAAEQGTSAMSENQAHVYHTKVLPILAKPISDEERFHAALEQDWRDEQREG